MTRHSVILLLLLAGLSGGVLAADPSQDVAAERARIAAERSQAEAVFQAEQKACYARFAVSGCIEDAKARRRELLGDLRRQEVALNDAERKARSAERMRQLEQKQAEQARKQSEAAAAAPAQRAAREQRAQEKARKARTAAEPPMPKAAASRAQRAPTEQPDAEANRRRYEERQRDAEAHKANVQQRAAEHKKPVKPLPVPP